MPCGFMGRVLWVDLSNEKNSFKEEIIPEEIYKKFLSGYDLAAHLIFERQKPGLEAFDPGNILGIMTGMLTGTGAFFSGRWMAVGKSPLTGTWGDANCGGYLAPVLKKTGYDGIFFTGKSKKPVYLFIDGDKKELLDAGELWGKLDTNETEDKLKEIHGNSFQVASIGPSGEKLSLIAGIVNDYGLYCRAHTGKAHQQPGCLQLLQD